MKVSRSKNSPWSKRLYFEPIEFEIMMDGLRQSAGDKCFTEGKGIDVELVLLKGYKCDPDYIDLPINIMGRTIFSSDGQAEVQISKELADKAQIDIISRKRLRTTIAHEIGHIACHRTLFMKDESTLPIFIANENEVNREVTGDIMCRESSIDNYKYSGQWWEYQANQCMAALILPKLMLTKFVNSQLESSGIDDFDEAIKAKHAEQIIRNTCDLFDVSQEAMIYRLKELGYISNPNQFRLKLEN